MQMSVSETTIVSAKNSEFGGKALNQEIAAAVQLLSSDNDLKTADSSHVATAIGSLMAGSNAMPVSRAQEGDVSAPSSPSGRSNPNKRK